MKLLLMSDIHGNKNALDAVLADLTEREIDACALLGDLIDYGMHSNEVIEKISSLPYPILCNICGNHESAVLNDEYARFSSERGRDCARYTKSVLNSKSWDYIGRLSVEGKCEFTIDGKRCLAVHGSLKDNFWKSITVTDELSDYSGYDYVFSGHSHLPHFFEKFFSCENVRTRNKKKTIFINPGSVGQPRNLNNFAQYAIFDTDSEEVVMKKVPYDIEDEQSAYNGQVDEFYKNRLKEGV
ncbi:MAG: metallophosphatase family protein [Clostridia bacterium]|nr:metallophosphatase family protein [Clostridia bacterium]